MTEKGVACATVSGIEVLLTHTQSGTPDGLPRRKCTDIKCRLENICQVQTT